MRKLVKRLLEYKYWLVVGITIFAFGVFTKEPLLVALFPYVGFLSFLLEAKISRKIRIVISSTIFLAFAVLIGMIFYSHQFLPRGEFYQTGEFVCQNEEGGPCAPEVREDLRNLNIPAWAIFVRTSAGKLLAFALCFAAIVSIKSGDSESMAE